MANKKSPKSSRATRPKPRGRAKAALSEARKPRSGAQRGAAERSKSDEAALSEARKPRSGAQRGAGERSQSEAVVCVYRVAQGNEPAFERLLERHWPVL